MERRVAGWRERHCSDCWWSERHIRLKNTRLRPDKGKAAGANWPTGRAFELQDFLIPFVVLAAPLSPRGRGVLFVVGKVVGVFVLAAADLLL